VISPGVTDGSGKKTEIRKSLGVFEKNSKGPKSDNHGQGMVINEKKIFFLENFVKLRVH
jgi:hypothetical protein